jgi:hypothetical protein
MKQRHPPNHRLRALLAEADWTQEALARAVNHLGAEIGFFAVLHTWGQNLMHHPHVHCVVPGGGLSADGERWVPCRPGFFLPVRVLSRVLQPLTRRRGEWRHESSARLHART